MPTDKAEFELSLTRSIAAPPEKVWHAMTERLTEWWCPRPWRTEVIGLDWRAGGRFEMVMRGPDSEGGESPIAGVILDYVPNRRLVFINTMTAGWIPHEADMFPMIGVFEISPEGEGTRYTASARHWDAEAVKKHEEMGFREGWGACADQLAELVEGVSA